MAEYAIFDTETDRFFTSNWPQNMCYKILRSWKYHHPNLKMTRFELRTRPYDDLVIDNSVILIIQKATNQIVAYFHWDNRGYALSFNPNEIFFIKYKPPQGQDMTDIMGRNDLKLWDGIGEKLDTLK
jgi:hypothetical protein